MDFNYSTNTVLVNRLKLVEMLKSNMKKHVDEYNKATTQFRLDVIAEYEKILNNAKIGGAIPLHLSENNRPPVSQEREYKRAIAKFEASVNENVALDDNQFDQYWLDEWQWSHTISNSFYASKAL